MHYDPVPSLGVIICGFERGGTTLIEELFRRYSSFQGAFEIGFLLCRKPEDFLNCEPHVSILMRTWKINKESLEYICRGKNWAEAYERLRERSDSLSEKTAKLFDKTPAYMRSLSDVMTRASSTPCIVIVRDPRSVIWSWSKRSRIPGIIWKRVCLKGAIIRYNWYGEGYAKAIANGFSDRILLVKYEELCMNPVEEVKRMFDFAGLVFEREKVSLDSPYGGVYGKRISAEYITEYRKGFSKKVCDRILSGTQQFADWHWRSCL